MPAVFLLTAAILLSCSKSLLYRGVSDITGNKTGFWLVNTLSFGTACVIQFLITLFTGGLQLSPFTVLLVLPFFVFTLASQYFYITAQKLGAVSLNTFIYSCGFILPTIYGILWLKEPFDLLQGIGILVMLGAIYLYLLPGKQNTFRVFWLVCILCASLCSGTIGILQKIQRSQGAETEQNTFLFLTFLLCTLASAVIWLLNRRKSSADTAVSLEKRSVFLALLIGAVLGIANLINLFLAGKLPSAVFFPVLNGSVTLLSGIGAYLIFREKMNLRQIIALCIGIVAIILIS